MRMKLVAGEVRTRQSGNLVATMWRDKRDVSLLSTSTPPEPEIHAVQQVVWERESELFLLNWSKSLMLLLCTTLGWMGSMQWPIQGLLFTWNNFSKVVEIPFLVLPQFVHGEWLYPWETSWQKEATPVRFSTRTRQASYRQIQWLQTILKLWKACCLHVYNRGKFAGTLSGKTRRPEKRLCHVCKGWKKTQRRPRPHLRNIRMWTVWRSFVSPNVGWKVLLWWMAQLDFVEMKRPNFSFIVYPCYFYYNAVLLWKWSHACGVALHLLTIVCRWTQQIYFIVQ